MRPQQWGFTMDSRPQAVPMSRRSRATLADPHQVMCHLLLGFIVLLSLSACSRRYSDLPPYLPYWFEEGPNESVGRFKTSYLAEQIDEYYRGANPGPIGVTTFVNIDDLYTTSTFGRMVAEQVMSELTMKGYDVVELRHSDALQFLNPGGEFALSRERGSVRRQRELGGVVVGTYVVSPVRVYVNARLVDPSSSVVLSAGSVEMSKSKEIARMLRNGSVPGTLERIPVRHLGHQAYPAMMWPGMNLRRFEEEMPGGEDFSLTPQFAPGNRSTAR